MKKWIKNKIGITKLAEENKSLKKELSILEAYVCRKMHELKQYTRVDADVGIRGNNTIILTGVYRRRAYVKFYDMGDANFIDLVEQLKEMRKHSLIRHIDAPPNFKGVFDLTHNYKL